MNIKKILLSSIFVFSSLTAHAVNTLNSENHYKNLFKDDEGFRQCIIQTTENYKGSIVSLQQQAPTMFAGASIRYRERKFSGPIPGVVVEVLIQLRVPKYTQPAPDPSVHENPDLYVHASYGCEHYFTNAREALNYVPSDLFTTDSRPPIICPTSTGSVIDFDKKTVAESIPIVGTEFSLNYSSEFNANTNVNRKLASSYTFLRNINSSYRQVVTDVDSGVKISEKSYTAIPPYHFNADISLSSTGTTWHNTPAKSYASVKISLIASASAPSQCYNFELESGEIVVRCTTAYYDENGRPVYGYGLVDPIDRFTDYELNSIEKKATLYHPEVWGLHGWTISEHHYFDRETVILYAGHGEKIRYSNLKTISDPILGIIDVVLSKSNENEIFIFDQLGKHLETRDAIFGHAIYKFGYDSNNKLISISDRFNSKTNFVYASGILQKIVSPFGVETKFQTSQSRIVKAFDPENLGYEMAYDSLGLLTSFKSVNGVVTTFIYNADGEFEREEKNNGLLQYFVKTVVDGVNTITKNLNFGLDRKIVSTVTIDGPVVQEKDNENNVILEQKRSYQYNITEFSFDSDKTTQTFQQSSEWGADKINLSTSVKEVTESGQNIRATTNIEETKEYESQDNVLKLQSYSSTTATDGGVLQNSFTKVDNKLITTDFFGNQTEMKFDSSNLLSRISSVDRYPTDFQYDSVGRLTKVLKGTQFESYSYDARGYLASTNNNKNQLTQFVRNKKGQLLKKILPNLDEIEFQYSDGGEVKKIIAPNGQIHNFEMSLGDYVTQAITPNSKVVSYEYDSDKRLTKVNKPSGKFLSYEYEPGKSDLKKISTPNGPVIITERDIRSRIKSITSSDNIRTDITWASDQVQSQTWYDNGQLIAKLSTNFAEDQFKAKSIFLNDNLIASYGYQNGVLSSIDNLGYTYTHEFGDKYHVQRITNNAGFVIDYTEQDTLNGDKPEQLISAQVYDGPEAQLYITLKRAYDSFGQATEFTTTTFNQATGTYNSYFSLLPIYDANDRLVRIDKTRKSFANGIEVNSLDFVNQYLYPAGSNNNVKTYQQSISVNHTQTPIKRTFASHNIDDQLTKLQGSINRDYKYNQDGELSEMTNCYGSTTYDYDSFGNLKKVVLPGGKVIEYKVDASNRRFKKLVNGQVTEYYLWYDQIRLAAILDGNKNPKAIYVYGSESANVPGYVIKDGKTYKIIHDPGTQSVRYIVDSENAMIIQESEYDEHGNIMKNTNAEFQPLGFAGGLYDADTKFVRFGARDYDPTVGRWTTKDPIGFAGGDTNLYAYVGGDPMSYVDPTGMYEVCTRPLIGFAKEYGPLRHEYLCANGVCGGQTPSGSQFGSAGVDSNDGSAGSTGVNCKQGPKENQECMDKCIVGEIGGSRPIYNVVNVGGSNCQKWANDAINRCKAQCGGK